MKAVELFPVAALSISLSDRPLLGPMRCHWAVPFVHNCCNVINVLSHFLSAFPVDVRAVSSCCMCLQSSKHFRLKTWMFAPHPDTLVPRTSSNSASAGAGRESCRHGRLRCRRLHGAARGSRLRPRRGRLPAAQPAGCRCAHVPVRVQVTNLLSRTVLRAAPRTVFCARDLSLPAARLNAVRAWPAEGMETLGRAVRGCGSLIWRARLHALPTVMTIG